MSHLRVYDTDAPDGLAGGTPHVHTLCTEAYAVVAGSGAVQTLTSAAYEEVPLEPGSLVWFTPGTIHRLVNRGGLEILVLMQNAGLPEAGDMVVVLDPEVMADPARYAEVAVLPEGDRTTASADATSAARARRDAAVVAFNELCRSHADGDRAPLERFHDAAVRLVRPQLERFRSVWERGPLAAAAATGEHLDAIARADPAHLAAASVHELAPPAGARRLGCCGTLGTYVA